MPPVAARRAVQKRALAPGRAGESCNRPCRTVGRLPNRRRRTTMVGRLLVGIREREDAAVAPEAAEERDAERIAAAADEAAWNGDLRQAGERALLARARLAAEPLEPALVRVRPREVRGIQQRVEALLVHQADEEIAEGFAARDELGARSAELVAGRRRRDRRLEPPRAHRRQLSRREKILDRDRSLARLRAAREIGRPCRRERARLGAARGAVPRGDVRGGGVDDRRAGGAQLAGDGLHHRRDLALAGEADEALAQQPDARAFERR